MLFATCFTLTQTINAQKQKPSTYCMMVFSNSVAGQEDTYNTWYDSQYLPGLVAIPGFVTAQRFVVSETQLRPRITEPLPKYLVMYSIVTNNLASVYVELNHRVKTSKIPMSPALDKSSLISFTYKAIRPTVYRKDAPRPGSQIYYQLVFTDPVPGKEAEYNEWYDNVHMPYQVAAPGFVSARRYILSDTDERQKFSYFVLYKIVTDDLAAAFAEFRRGPQLPVSPAFGKSLGYTYKAIGPIIKGDKVRSERAQLKQRTPL